MKNVGGRSGLVGPKRAIISQLDARRGNQHPPGQFRGRLNLREIDTRQSQYKALRARDE